MEALMNYQNRTLLLKNCSAEEVRLIVATANEHDVVVLLHQIKGDTQTIMATLADFQTKIDTINANTTASAQAAQAVAAMLTALKAQLDQVLTDAGVPAAVEADILAQLDSAAGTTGAHKTFLEATATPGTPEPSPVPAPEPTV